MAPKTPVLSTSPARLKRWFGRLLFEATTKRRILTEGSWVAFGEVISALGLLVGIRLLTEFVPPDVFGTVRLLVGIMMFGSQLVCFPQLQAALRFYPDLARAQQTNRLRLTLGRSLRWTTLLIAGLFLLGGAGYSSSTYLSYWVFVALASLLIFEVLRSFETAFLTAARRQRPFALWRAGESCARPALAILAVLAFGATPEAVLVGYMAATGGFLMLFLLLVRREGLGTDRQEDVANRALTREIRQYALPLVPLAFVAWVSSFGDTYIIAAVIGVEAVGVYAAAYALMSHPFILAQRIIELTLRPVYYGAVSSGNGQLERKTFTVWLWTTVVVCIIGVVAVCFLSKWIAALLLAEKYRPAASLMPWIACGRALFVISLVFEKTCHAYKRTQWVLIIRTAGAMAAIAVGIPLICAYGIHGAAMAAPMYFGLQTIVSVVAKKSVEKHENLVSRPYL